MRKFCFIVSIVVFVNMFFSIANAEIKTYTGIGEYITDNSETPDFAQQNARLYAERNACEQAGVFISSVTEVKNNIMAKDEIETFTVGILKVKSNKAEVIKLTGEAAGYVKYRVTVDAEVDTSQFAVQVKQWLNRSEEKRQELISQTVSMQKIIDKQRKQIATLEKDLQNIKTAQDKKKLKNEVTNVQKIALYSQKVREAIMAKRTAEKVKLYTEAIKINPNGAEAYFGRALSLNNRQQEIADLSRAIEIDPNYADAYYFRAGNYALDSEYTLAVVDYTKVIELKPDYIEAYEDRAESYEELGQYEKAVSDYSTVIERNPNKSLYYASRASCYQELNDYERAIEDYTKFLKMENPRNVNNPRLHSYYRSLGLCYQAIGDKEKARAAFMMSM